MEEAWGQAPSTPDYDHHAIGAIDDATWREQVLRETEYLVTAAERIAQVNPVRLLMVGINLLDAHEHQFLRSDPRHPIHGRATPAEQTRFRDLIEDAYHIADNAVGRIAVHARSTVVASEYALLPVHSRVQLAFALALHGLRVSGDDADVRVIASSASAHIRLNVRGREPTGAVQDSIALRERIVDVLRGLADPRTGEPLLARITTPSTGAPGTGDIHVIASPGYALAHDPAATSLIDTPFLPGEHAFDPALAETHGIFIAAGPLFPAHSDSLGLHAADVAVSVAGMLGIDPPIGATGRSLLR
jgi:hypothetical protein